MKRRKSPPIGNRLYDINNFKFELKNILNQGIIKRNPVFVLAIALTPLLAVSDTLDKAIWLGMTVLFIMVLVNLVVSIFSYNFIWIFCRINHRKGRIISPNSSRCVNCRKVYMPGDRVL